MATLGLIDMDYPPLQVAIASLPEDNFGYLLDIASGIGVPIMLLVITLLVNYLSARQTRKYAEKLVHKEKIEAFKVNAHQVLDNLFKELQILRLVNLKRKKHQAWLREATNNEIKASGEAYNIAIAANNEVYRWHTEKILDLDSKHGVTLIEVRSAQARAQQVLDEEHTAKMDHVINQIADVSATPGLITEEMQQEFVDQLNELMKRVETEPEVWVKP